MAEPPGHWNDLPLAQPSPPQSPAHQRGEQQQQQQEQQQAEENSARKPGAVSNSSDLKEATEAIAELKARYADEKRSLNWLNRCQELVDFKAANGHCRISTANMDLYAWCKRQRNIRDSLSKEQLDLLDKIGFFDVSDASDTTTEADAKESSSKKKKWNEMLQKFRQLRNEGNEQGETKDSELANWIRRQRGQGKQLPPERRALLLEIDPNFFQEVNRSWNESYKLLVAFKEKHGHCNVGHSCRLLFVFVGVFTKNVVSYLFYHLLCFSSGANSISRRPKSWQLGEPSLGVWL